MNKLVFILGASILASAGYAGIFTTENGYTDGLLNDNADWTTTKDWTVDTSTGTAATTLNSSIAVNNTQFKLAVGDTLSASTTFSIGSSDNNWVSSAANQQLSVFNFQSDASTDKSSVNGFNVNIYAAGHLQIRYNNNTAAMATTDDLSSLGLTESTLLKMDYSLTLGTAASNSIVAANLSYYDDVAGWTTLTSGSYEGLYWYDKVDNVTTEYESTDLYNAALSDGLFAATGSSWQLANASKGTADSMTMEDFTVIPEPATVGMLGLGALGLLVLRRFVK